MSLGTKAAPLILVRGLIRDTRHWGDLPERLSKQLNRPVFGLDLPGCGSRYRERSPTNIEQMAEALQEQLEQLCPDQKVHLLAISMGGMIGLYWQSLWPERFLSCCLINSSQASLSPFYLRLKWRNYPRVMASLLLGGRYRQKQILQMTVNGRVASESVIKQWQDWQQQQPVSTGNALRQLWAASQCRFEEPPTCPTLLLASKLDRLVDVGCSQAIAKQWHLPLVLHPWAGHDLPLDDPDWLLAQMKQWLDRQAVVEHERGIQKRKSPLR